MSIATLDAARRIDAAKKVRREGFTPAVIYGHDFEEGLSIQFQSSKLLATVKKHGVNARVSVNLDGDSKYGAIKEVQLHPVTNEIRHIDIQVFKEDDIVKLTVPIYFTGADELIAQRLVASTVLSELEFTGPAISIPGHLTVDLSDAKLGYTVTVGDLGISDEFRLSAALEDVVVTVTMADEEPEEDDLDEEVEEIAADEVELVDADDEDEEEMEDEDEID